MKTLKIILSLVIFINLKAYTQQKSFKIPDTLKNKSINYIVEGYWNTDVNLDGNTINVGPNNDSNLILIQMIINSQVGIVNLTEQIP